MARTKGKRPPTLKDVAGRAGVSPKTVSNVVNNWPYVTEQTREKVLKEIKATGYRPSVLARSLVTGETRTIGVVITDISNPFFGQAIRGCEDGLNDAGYSIVLCDTDENLAKEQQYLNTLGGKGIDGLILWGGRSTKDEVLAAAGNIPIVAIDTDCDDKSENITVIEIANEKGAQNAVGHLLRAGRRRIGYLAGPGQRQTAEKRLSGYRQALADARIAFDPCLVVSGLPSIRGGYEATLRLLDSQAIDALFCYNDLMAIGAIVACNHKDLSIPGDVGLVGFDDISMSALISPSLTTVRIAQYDLGKLAASLLLDRLQGRETEPRKITFPTELQIRNSCGTKVLTRQEIGSILESMVQSIAVDLPGGYPKNCEGAEKV
jgi:LacI family transcriptional regulator